MAPVVVIGLVAEVVVVEFVVEVVFEEPEAG